MALALQSKAKNNRDKQQDDAGIDGGGSVVLFDLLDEVNILENAAVDQLEG